MYSVTYIVCENGKPIGTRSGAIFETKAEIQEFFVGHSKDRILYRVDNLKTHQVEFQNIEW